MSLSTQYTCVIALQPIDTVIATWKRMSDENLFVDSLEPIAFWCLKYQSPGWYIFPMSAVAVTMIWVCWLGGRKGIQPVKNWVVGCWRGCLRWGADLNIAQQMPLPLTISCSSKSRLVLTFLVYLSGTCSPRWSWTYSRRAVKRLCVCCVCVCVSVTCTLVLSRKGLNSGSHSNPGTLVFRG